jgi:hypothetical protein
MEGCKYRTDGTAMYAKDTPCVDVTMASPLIVFIPTLICNAAELLSACDGTRHNTAVPSLEAMMAATALPPKKHKAWKTGNPSPLIVTTSASLPLAGLISRITLEREKSEVAAIEPPKATIFPNTSKILTPINPDKSEDTLQAMM